MIVLKAEKLDLYVNHKLHHKIASVAVVLLFVLNMGAFIINPMILVYFNLMPMYSVTQFVMVFYMNFFETFYSFQFCLASLMVRERFQLLNKNLEKTCKRRSLKFYKNLETPILFQQLSRLYFDLCDVISQLNSTFPAHLILTFFNILVGILRINST